MTPYNQHTGIHIEHLEKENDRLLFPGFIIRIIMLIALQLYVAHDTYRYTESAAEHV